MPFIKCNFQVAPVWPDYGCNIFKDGVFVEGRIYKNYSGNAMMDEVKDMKRFEFPVADGYTIEW